MIAWFFLGFVILFGIVLIGVLIHKAIEWYLAQIWKNDN